MVKICIRSKSCKNDHLLSDPVIARYLPHTLPMNLVNLQLMLNRYPIIYLKPDVGSLGYGIYRIDRIASNEFCLRKEGATIVKGPSGEIGQAVTRLCSKKPYLLQQGIESVTHKGLPFDVRVHVQRVNGSWLYGGSVGKLGRKKSIITNRHRGGLPISIQSLFSNHLKGDPHQQKILLNDIKNIAIRIARVMEKHFPRRPEYGLDIGIDKKQFWVYEVNTSPGIMVFAKLSDRGPIKRILSLRKKNLILR
ncbi:YheC/YheD family protein [Marininema halotolerans]|uniref:YheC/D like ATP-grasp n=1 Tax=Marininema halotolerans TaxID=1155944 RepID=A0A1I6RXS5_9BACL|nr:YheC/YheD family protein [Marininema halotolerans]SFS69476.1 YheC/D like ATP-grasp [Marininema halotolerans]